MASQGVVALREFCIAARLMLDSDAAKTLAHGLIVHLSMLMGMTGEPRRIMYNTRIIT